MTRYGKGFGDHPQSILERLRGGKRLLSCLSKLFIVEMVCRNPRQDAALTRKDVIQRSCHEPLDVLWGPKKRSESWRESKAVLCFSLARSRRRLRKKNDAVKSCLAESRIFESAQMKEEMVLFIIRSRSKWQLSACWLRLGRRVRFSSSSTFEWDWCEHFPATKTNNQNRRKTTTQWTQKARIF